MIIIIKYIEMLRILDQLTNNVHLTKLIENIVMLFHNNFYIIINKL